MAWRSRHFHSIELITIDPVIYPSRLSVSDVGYRLFTSIARRLNRIYSHAYWAHADLFWEVERSKSPYEFFLAVITEHSLMDEKEILINFDACPQPMEGVLHYEEDTLNLYRDPMLLHISTLALSPGSIT